MIGLGFIIIAAVIIVSVIYLARQIINAPPGWEDENGFHVGTRKKIEQPGGSDYPSGLFTFTEKGNLMDTINEFHTVQQETNPTPEGYVNCKTCGSILGYKAHVGKALFMFVYAYPAPRCRDDLAGRRVNARILEGDVYCHHCDTWQEWSFERKWEKEKPQ
jgi:hypothetical protein